MTKMFCYQCEQTANNEACTTHGVCGKSPEVAILQDLLTHVVKAISMYAHRARELGKTDDMVNAFTLEALFTTVTNVNFDVERMQTELKRAWEVKKRAMDMYEKACSEKGVEVETLSCPAPWKPDATKEGLLKQGECAAIDKRIKEEGATITGLQELLTYAIRGAAAYSYHAYVLGKENPEIYAFMHRAMDAIVTETDIGKLFELNMECGKMCLDSLALLDEANTTTFGHPEPTEVSTGHIKGKAILVSGHDLKDLKEILEQTEGKGINVYTHGEMMPALAYPALKKHAHLVGHYGTAWQNQRKEFAEFPGAIIMTTNSIQKPKTDYIGRIFTCGPVAFEGVTHIGDHDYSPAIDAALEAPGFVDAVEGKKMTIGFGHNAVLGVADAVIDAVKGGAVEHFMLVGGCDGTEGERSYYSDIVDQAPDNWLILTLGCGKFRVINRDLGNIGPFPRVLDMGQCNDSYSAIKVAAALADAFGTDVNGLPLSLVLSWFEQKAVTVLMALLHLGITDIRIGPRLPAFVTPEMLDVLVEKFAIKPIGTAEEDLKAMKAA